MSPPRIIMRQVREVLRLSLSGGRSIPEVSQAFSLAKSTVSDYVKRAKQAGLSWPPQDDLDDDALKTRLFGAITPAVEVKPMPARPCLSAPGVESFPHDVNVCLDQYREAHPDGYGYTQLCEYYRRFAGAVILLPCDRRRRICSIFRIVAPLLDL